jgi:single-strand DNA-binding protein
MASENIVTLVGNITDDPELRFTPSGLPVANFTVAVNRRVPKDGGWEDKLEGFFRCSCWRDMAENVAESLQKGARVMVVGRLQQRSWEDQDGNKRSAVEVQVDEVGPSLRWATARPERSQRSGGGGSQPDRSQGSSPPPASSGGDSWGPPASVGGSAPDEGGF